MVHVFELWSRVSTFPGLVEKTRIYPIAYGEINEAGLQFNHKFPAHQIAKTCLWLCMRAPRVAITEDFSVRD